MNETEDLDDREEVQALLVSIRAAMPELEELLAACGSQGSYEDPVYRFYHQSFKVYSLQATTAKTVAALQGLAPDRPLHEWFCTIIEAGTGKTFEREHNQRWLEVTRPILEAFFHARYFLEMAVRYGRELKQPPQTLPSGWAALLYLYRLR